MHAYACIHTHIYIYVVSVYRPTYVYIQPRMKPIQESNKATHNRILVRNYMRTKKHLYHSLETAGSFVLTQSRPDWLLPKCLLPS